MGFLDLFDSGDKKRRLSHIRNLVLLSALDGHIDRNELELIGRIGRRVGITNSELERIIKRPQSVDFKAPNNFAERLVQLYDMVLVMMVDGELHKNEIVFCKATALSLGFKHEVIEGLVLGVIDMIAKGLAVDIVLANMNKKYN